MQRSDADSFRAPQHQMTPLLLAIRGDGEETLVQMLLDAGADTEAKEMQVGSGAVEVAVGRLQRFFLVRGCCRLLSVQVLTWRVQLSHRQ